MWEGQSVLRNDAGWLSVHRKAHGYVTGVPRWFSEAVSWFRLGNITAVAVFNLGKIMDECDAFGCSSSVGGWAF
eukprot:8854340-Ditylum_brightwellii.AAC.1